MDLDDLEYILDGLRAKSKSSASVRRKSAIELCKLCSTPKLTLCLTIADAEAQAAGLDSSESRERDATKTLYSTLAKTISSSKEPTIVWYCLLTITLLSRSSAVNGICLPPSLMHAFDHILRKFSFGKNESLLQPSDRTVVFAQVRKQIDLLFLPNGEVDNDSELEYGYETFLPKWIKMLDERDLCMMSLLQMLHVCNQVETEETDHKNKKQKLGQVEVNRGPDAVSSFKKNLASKNGKFFQVLIDLIFNDMTSWMCMSDSEENFSAKLLTLWRLGNAFQIVSKSMYKNKNNKAVLAGKAKDAGVLKELINVTKWCNDWLVANSTDSGKTAYQIISHCLLSSCRVMTDITDGCDTACGEFGSSEMQLILDMLIPQTAALASETENEGSKVAATSSWNFDFALILLGLLTNCVESHAENRRTFGKLKKKKAVLLVVDMFLKTLPPNIVDALKNPKKRQEEVDFDWKPEQLVISSHVCLLIGCLMRENKENKLRILRYIPGHSPVIMIHVLRAFLAFQKDARVLSPEALVGISSVISDLEKMLKIVKEDKQVEKEKPKEHVEKKVLKSNESVTSPASGKSTHDAKAETKAGSKPASRQTPEKSRKKKKGIAISWEDI